MLLSECVETSPVPGKRSMFSQPSGWPPVTPYLTSRAAVRCATPMPSPSMMMTFFARLPPLSSRPKASTIWKRELTCAIPVASLNSALMVCQPGSPLA